jgi:hypothetical protein
MHSMTRQKKYHIMVSICIADEHAALLTKRVAEGWSVSNYLRTLIERDHGLEPNDLRYDTPTTPLNP